MSPTSPTLDPAEQLQRELLCEMLRLFYDKGWVSGTGGGICGVTHGGLLVAPTGVHKERVRPEDFFVIDPAGTIVNHATDKTLHPSECTPIFAEVVRARGAGSVVHSHALSAVLAADLTQSGDDTLVIEGLEMLKGIRGSGYPGEHRVPVIGNTARERDLTGDVERVLKDSRFESSFAILVRDHGVYIWGSDIWEAKRHTEVYHFLFEATKQRRS